MPTLRGARRRLVAAALALGGRPPLGVGADTEQPANADGIVLEEHSSPRVSILIPVFGQLKVTLDCVRSLAALTTTIPFEVLVLDDATDMEDMSLLSSIIGVRYHRSEHNRGFLLNVNWGATFAQGEILLLLNNDTLVDEGFLDPLIETLDEDPTVGAVGSLLMYPGGVVQEAGGIIWNDASGWNYGRHDDAADSRNLWRREVDYCSGASLAVRRTLWDQLGGFDEQFAPAYYEDTDLCFAIRELGYKVVFEPRSRVTHLEGVSHGTSVGGGVKQHQLVNQARFLQKWRHRLVDHYPPSSDHLFDARARHEGQRLIVIDHMFPRPLHDSGSVRMAAIVELLHSMGLLVHFIPLDGIAGGPLLERWQHMGIEVLYGSHDLGDVLRQLCRSVDAVVLSRPHVAAHFMLDLRRRFPTLPLVYDMVDAHGLRLHRGASLSTSESEHRVARAEAAMEIGMCNAADLVIAVSAEEQEMMKGLCDIGVQFAVLPNIHRPIDDVVGIEGRAGALFVGGYRHPPNVDAAMWLAREVWPLVRDETVVTMVGSDAPEEVLALESERVHVAGWVEDLAPLYQSTRVVVAPLRFGAGVKGKVGEALSHGVPVVTTSIGAEGMGLVDGESALIADSAEEFAAAIRRLNIDHVLWTRLSVNGRRHVECRFGLRAAEVALRGILDGVGIRPRRTLPDRPTGRF
jgi:GT2 family glycosyltransferase